MEIKKGDKLILPLAEVIALNEGSGGVSVTLPGGSLRTYIQRGELEHCIKVLGLLGDEGLEPKVGMKVWDSVFGEGEIIRTSEDNDFCYITFNGKELVFTAEGRWYSEDNRSCYVTAMPEEPKGWAWVMGSESTPYTYYIRVTKSEAEEQFGERLIHWVSEI